MVASPAQCTLEDVMVNAKLDCRASRPADHQAENNALKALAQTMVESPDSVLQKLVKTALHLCRAHSAGISIIEKHDEQEVCRWWRCRGSLGRPA